MDSTFGLDMLAEVASAALRTTTTAAARDDETSSRGEPFKQPATRAKRGRGSGQPRRLVDYDQFDVSQIVRMSGPTLLRMFAEQDFDEVARRYRYNCAFLPHRCQHSAQSFGNESKAKHGMKVHLQEHVRAIREDPQGYEDFTAESVEARRRRNDRIRSELEAMGSPAVRTLNEDRTDSRKRKQWDREELETKPKFARAIKAEQHSTSDYDQPVQSADQKPCGWAALGEDHCYAKGIVSLRSDPTLEEEDPAQAMAEEQTLREQEQWIRAVREGKKTDLLIQRGPDDAGLGTGNDLASSLSAMPAVGAELTLVESASQDLGRMPAAGAARKARQGSTDSSSSSAQPADGLSEREALERQRALDAIQQLKAQGSTAVDFCCTICEPGRRFTAYTTLLSHLRSHAGVRPYECHQCNSVFTRQHSLNYHMLIHDNKMRFTCSDCGKMFRHPSHYKEHLRRHTGESPYECSECAIRYKTRNTYKRHLKVFHGKELGPSGELRPLPAEELARIKSGELKKEREKMEKRRKKQLEAAAAAAPPPAVVPVAAKQGQPAEPDDRQEFSSLLHDNAVLLANEDEEVTKISQHLQEQEGMLEGRARVPLPGSQADSVSSEGSYYPSTDSEFSSPDTTQPAKDGDEESKAGGSPPLPEFDSSPPSGLIAAAPRDFRADQEAAAVDDSGSQLLQNQDKSPNLLERVADSAFNPIGQKKGSSRRRLVKTLDSAGSGSFSNENQADADSPSAALQAFKAAPARPLQLQQLQQPEPKQALALPATAAKAPLAIPQSNKAILANIDGKQVLLIPATSVHGGKPAAAAPAAVKQVSFPKPPEGTSKLEQCLRYGSAAAMNPKNVQQAAKMIAVSSSSPSVTPVVAPASVGHTFMLSEPININLPRAVAPAATVLTPASALTSSVAVEPNPAVRKISSIRLVPVASPAEAGTAKATAPAPVLQTALRMAPLKSHFVIANGGVARAGAVGPGGLVSIAPAAAAVQTK